jgi:hypothetical protein
MDPIVKGGENVFCFLFFIFRLEPKKERDLYISTWISFFNRKSA